MYLLAAERWSFLAQGAGRRELQSSRRTSPGDESRTLLNPVRGDRDPRPPRTKIAKADLPGPKTRVAILVRGLSGRTTATQGLARFARPRPGLRTNAPYGANIFKLGLMKLNQHDELSDSLR